MSSFPIGVEGEARNLIEKYGRAEGCASSLAAACGKSSETVNQLQARTTNVGVLSSLGRFLLTIVASHGLRMYTTLQHYLVLTRSNFQGEQRILHPISLGAPDRSEKLK